MADQTRASIPWWDSIGLGQHKLEDLLDPLETEDPLRVIEQDEENESQEQNHPGLLDRDLESIGQLTPDDPLGGNYPAR